MNWKKKCWIWHESIRHKVESLDICFLRIKLFLCVANLDSQIYLSFSKSINLLDTEFKV